jgi:hypothetical protein
VVGEIVLMVFWRSRSKLEGGLTSIVRPLAALCELMFEVSSVSSGF